MKLKQFYQQTHDLIQLLKVQFPHITVQMLTLAFCRSTPNFIVLFGYSRILDLLLTSQFQEAIQIVAIMLVSSYLLSFIGNWIDSYLQGYEFITDEVIMSQVNYMSFTMRYDIFEDNDSMTKVRAVSNRMNATGGTGSFLQIIILLCTNLFSALYAFCFVGYLFYQAMQYSFYLVLLLLLAVGCICLGVMILKRTSAYYEDLNKRNIHNNSVFSYLLTTMVNVEYKKQMMINRMGQLFEKYFKNIIQTFHVYLDFSKRKGRYESVYNFVLSIFGACTYIYIAYLSLRGYLSIGSVLLYAGAMQQLIQYISGCIISYSDAVFQTLYIAIRLMLMIMITTCLTATTKPLDMTLGIEDLLMPLKRFHVPAHEIAMLISIALRFIPDLIEETQRIMKAQQSRGVDMKEGKLMERVMAILSLIVPLFVSALQRAEDLANAMEARGYAPGEKRTRYKVLKMEKRDYFLLLGAFTTLIVMIGLAILL